jgi:ribosomal protein S18 acetylase RimI-like enzyme
MHSEYVEINDMPDVRGLRFRRYRGEEDLHFFHEVSRKEYEALDFDFLETLDDFILYYRNLVNCDPLKDILVAEIDGSMVGYARAWWTRKQKSGYNYNVLVTVDPELFGKGIVKAMFNWTENRSREIAKGHPDTESKEFQTWSLSNEDHWIGILESFGYSKVRYGYLMTRPLTGELPVFSLPEGLEVRPVSPDQYRTIWEADVEASKDMWEPVEIKEEYYQHWLKRSEFQPEKWQVAWEGDRVAGAVMPFINEEENKAFDRLRGYTEEIHVGRNWRGKGLAKALIARSFHLLRDLGMEEACLGVDAENPTGALKLYTAMGFETDKTFFTFRKAL